MRLKSILFGDNVEKRAFPPNHSKTPAVGPAIKRALVDPESNIHNHEPASVKRARGTEFEVCLRMNKTTSAGPHSAANTPSALTSMTVPLARLISIPEAVRKPLSMKD